MNKYRQSERIENEIRHFSELEHIWWGAKTPAGQRRYDNKFKDFRYYCQPKKNYRILEIGCGDGEFTKRLKSLSCTIIATDITPKVVEKAKKKVKGKNIQFLIDNAQNSHFKDNSIDIVCGISILHHIDPEKALKEAYRVLKPDGQIFFTEPNLLNPHIFLGLHILWFRSRMEFSPDETALMRWPIDKMLKDIGFKDVEVRNYDFLHPLTPNPLIGFVEGVGSLLERIPLVKEISGSLIIWARK